MENSDIDVTYYLFRKYLKMDLNGEYFISDGHANLTTPLKMKSNDNSEECDGFAMNCFLCPRIFTDIDELQEHLSVHSLEPPSQKTTTQQYFNCNVCERSLRSEKELNKHYKYYHESNMLRKANEANQRFECKYCENIYLSQKNLQLHMDSDHGTKIERAKRAKHSDKLYVAIQLVERKQKYPPRSPYFNPNLWINPNDHL